MKKTTSWGAVAPWYNDLLSQTGTYQHDLILPQILRLIPTLSHQTILDLGCGQGFFTKALGRNQAKLIGIDISPELIALATKQVPNATFYVGSADNLEKIPTHSIDHIVCVLAIQNIENVPRTFQECSRVLKNNGSISLVLNHPCFRIPKQSSWVWDQVEQKQFRRLDEYMSESKTFIDMHPGQKQTSSTVSFHRPLQYYIKLLTKQHLLISRMEEWTSHKHTAAGPRANAENKARQEFPLFLYLEAKKIAP